MSPNWSVFDMVLMRSDGSLSRLCIQFGEISVGVMGNLGELHWSDLLGSAVVWCVLKLSFWR